MPVVESGPALEAPLAQQAPQPQSEEQSEDEIAEQDCNQPELPISTPLALPSSIPTAAPAPALICVPIPTTPAPTVSVSTAAAMQQTPTAQPAQRKGDRAAIVDASPEEAHSFLALAETVSPLQKVATKSEVIAAQIASETSNQAAPLDNMSVQALPAFTLAATPAVTPTAMATHITVTGQLDLDSDGEWIDQLARDIVAVAGSDAKLRFSLSPQMLGHLDVAIEPQADGVAIQLQPSTENAARIIAAEQPKLVEELRQSGVRVTNSDFVGGQGPGNQNPGGQGWTAQQERWRSAPYQPQQPVSHNFFNKTARPSRPADRFA